MGSVTRRKFRFIGCEIIYREACHLAARCVHEVDVEFLLKGLHDLPTEDMRAKIQSAIDAVDRRRGYEAILLGYARCNDGVVGVRARDLPLVIPKAHDCITFLFGSRRAYLADHDAQPGTYYMSSGWAERNRFRYGDDGYDQPAYGKQGVMGKLGLAESYEQMVAKYGKDNADFIVASLGDWRKNYSRMLYLQMGVCDEQPYIAEARAAAAERNWTFDLRRGDLSLLERLFAGEWNDDFLIVAPGCRIAPRNDEEILKAEPA